MVRSTIFQVEAHYGIEYPVQRAGLGSGADLAPGVGKSGIDQAAINTGLEIRRRKIVMRCCELDEAGCGTWLDAGAKAANLPVRLAAFRGVSAQ